MITVRSLVTPDAPIAVRVLGDTVVAPGSNFAVIIATRNYGSGGRIEDTIPEGFTFVRSNPAGASFDSNTRIVSFTLVDEDRFEYTLTASSTAGDHSFSGTLRDSDLALHDIRGQSTVTVEAGLALVRAGPSPRCR